MEKVLEPFGEGTQENETMESDLTEKEQLLYSWKSVCRCLCRNTKKGRIITEKVDCFSQLNTVP